jgi:hypothetical protein
MANLTSQLLVRLVDGVSGPARVAARSLGVLQNAGKATAALGTTKQLAANARQVGRSVREVGRTVSAPLALAGMLGARVAFEYEKAGNQLEALGEATAAQRKEFEAMATTLNAKYPQSLTQIMKTGTELLKAGLNWQQMLGAMNPTLATAIIGEMKPSEVATMISSSLNAFQMPMETTKQAIQSTTAVADRLSYAAVKTTADLRDMGEMFKYVAGAASATGNSIDDVTAFAMAFAKNKIVGMEAGVALRSAIVRIAKGGTKQGRAALERVGMSFGDYTQGQRKVTTDRVLGGLMAGGIDASPIKAQIDALVNDPALANAPNRLAAKVTALVQEQLTKSGSAIDASTISEAVQDSIVAAGNKIDLMRFFMDLKKKVAAGILTLGDVANILEGRHFAKYQAIFQSDLEGLKADIAANAAGFTERTYKTTIKGIVGPVYELSAAVEALSVALGRSVFKDAAAAITSLANGITQLSQTSPAMLKWSVYLGGAAVALGPLGFAIAGVTAGATGLAAAFKLLTGAFLLNPIGLTITALTALALVIYQNWDAVKDWASKSIEALGRMVTWFSELPGRIGSAIAEAATGLYDAGLNLISQLWEGMKARFSALLGWVSGIGSSIAGAIGLGGGKPASGPTPAGRAMGGNVTRGRAYVVGERRRELFVPGMSGTIHPTTDIGGRSGATVTVHNTINVSGVGDPETVAQKVYQAFTDEFGRMFRGLQADTGLRYT